MSDNSPNTSFVIKNNILHIFQEQSDNIIHIVVQAPCLIKAASVAPLPAGSTPCSASAAITGSCKNHNWGAAIVATCDGQIWCVPLPCQTLGREKRESKSQKSQGENIFDDLLSEETSESKDAQFVDRDLDGQDARGINHQVVSISPQDWVYSSQDVTLDVETLGVTMCVLADRSGLAVLLLFKIPFDRQEKVPTERTAIRPYQTVPTMMCFTQFSSKSSTLPRKSLFFIKPVSETVTQTKSCPGAPTVSPAAVSHAALAVSHLAVAIPSLLFTLLFGQEAACLKSPVVLLCSNTGALYTLNIKSIKSTSEKSVRVFAAVSSEVVGVFAVNLCLPPADEESATLDIVSVLTSSLTSTGSNNCQQTKTCLVIICSLGKGLLFVPPDQVGEPYTEVALSLPQAVRHCIVMGDLLIYATENSVEACTLKLVPGNDGNTLAFSLVTRTLVKRARVVKLLPGLQPSQDAGITVYGITCHFDVISIPLERETPDSVQEDSHTLQEVLQSIEQYSGTFERLKKDSLFIDSLLLQLNVFASLTMKTLQGEFLNSTMERNVSSNNPCVPLISCTCRVTSLQNVYSRLWSLKVTLRNNSTVPLSKDWTVVVVLFDDIEDRVPAHPQFHQSFCIQLSQGLDSNSSMDILLPLDKLLTVQPLISVYVKVSLALCYRNIPTNMSHDLPCGSQHVDIHRQRIDILQFFHVVDDKVTTVGNSTLVNCISRYDAGFTKSLEQMADQRVRNRATIQSVVQGESQIQSVRIGVSKTACKELNLLAARDVLKFLLKDNVDITDDDISGIVLQLVDPHGCVVSVSVTSCDSGAKTLSSCSTEQSSFIITLTSRDASTLLQTRSAIKGRFKSFKASSSQLKSYEQLKNQLKVLEGLQKNLLNLRRTTAAQSSGAWFKQFSEILDKLDCFT